MTNYIQPGCDFSHWTIWDNIEHYGNKVLGTIRWRIFERSKRAAREEIQLNRLQYINRFFCWGWDLYGDTPGVYPTCSYKFGKAYCNTVFCWWRGDRTSYHYRIGHMKHEGLTGVFCIETGEIFEHDSEDLDAELTIAASALGFIVDGGDNLNMERLGVMKERIYAKWRQEKEAQGVL